MTFVKFFWISLCLYSLFIIITSKFTLLLYNILGLLFPIILALYNRKYIPKHNYYYLSFIPVVSDTRGQKSSEKCTRLCRKRTSTVCRTRFCCIRTPALWNSSVTIAPGCRNFGKLRKNKVFFIDDQIDIIILFYQEHV